MSSEEDKQKAFAWTEAHGHRGLRRAAVMDGFVAGLVEGRGELETLVTRVEALFDAIAHGSPEHRAWLRDAITDHFAGRPVRREEKP